jgi:hypothetical protein
VNILPVSPGISFKKMSSHWFPVDDEEYKVPPIWLMVGMVGMGFAVTANVCCGELPQALDADTPMFPELLPDVMTTLGVPWPELIDQPAGTNQLYAVAKDAVAV